MVSKEKMEMLKVYNQGLELYRGRKFTEAKSMFQKCLDMVPNDGPSQIYVDRCTAFIQSPPPADWDGVYVMKTK